MKYSYIVVKLAMELVPEVTRINPKNFDIGRWSAFLEETVSRLR